MRLLSTSTQVWLFLIGVSLACLIAGYEIGGRLGLFLGLLLTIGIHVFIFIFGDSRLLKRIHAIPVRGQDAWNLNEAIYDLSFRLGLPTPELSLVNTASPLAFTLGQPWRRGRLILSTGLLETLRPVEIRAVMAHQVGHLHHMDSFRFGVMAGLARLILGFANFLDRIWLPNLWLQRRQEPFLSAFSPLAWLILRFAVNAKSYFQNDDLAVKLVGDKHALAEALWKMEGLSRSRPYLLPPCTSHYFVVDPQGTRAANQWLESHPPVTSRIRRLIGTDTV
jgi:heat shock protein HtpX